jgi:hypothetical protein
MSDELTLARELLRQLLALGPQKGARLKVLLVREFERRSAATFHQAFWTFPKFSSFLAANADLVEVHAPDGPGDLTVRLRPQATPERAATPAPQLASPGRFLPPAVWNAFTNPDPRRRRFFNRVSREVVHYLENSQEPPNPRIAALVGNDANYVEIQPASAEQQAAWLKEFLASVPVPDSKRPLLTKLAEMPYSSAINTAFGATLGDLAESWRQFRAAKVQEVVRTWAERRGVALDQLYGLALSADTSHQPAHAQGASLVSAPLVAPTPVAASEMRRWLHTLVDALETPDLAQILVPAAILLKLSTRRG